MSSSIKNYILQMTQYTFLSVINIAIIGIDIALLFVLNTSLLVNVIILNELFDLSIIIYDTIHLFIKLYNRNA